jgi:hypothetical protein
MAPSPSAVRLLAVLADIHAEPSSLPSARSGTRAAISFSSAKLAAPL